MNSSKRIKLAFIVSSLANEGPVRILFGILSKLDHHRFEATVFTLIQERRNSIYENFKALGVPIVTPAPTESILGTANRLRKALHKLQFDVVHAHCPRSLWISFLVFPRSRICYTAHIFPGLQTDVLYGKLKAKFIRLISLYIIQRIGAPVACSESVSSEFASNTKIDIPFINNGCLLDVVCRTRDSIFNAKSRLGVKDESLTFLFVGRLSPEKNVLALTRSFMAISKGRPWTLLIVGEGPLSEELSKYASDQIRIEGFHENVGDYYEAADYYVSASLTEGLANTLLEAAAHGITPILSAIPSHQHFVRSAKLPDYLLFNPNEVESISNSIEQASRFPPLEFSMAMQSAYSASFSALAMTRSYEVVYESL